MNISISADALRRAEAEARKSEAANRRALEKRVAELEADPITLTFSDGRELQAKLVGRDRDTHIDVLKVWLGRRQCRCCPQA